MAGGVYNFFVLEGNGQAHKAKLPNEEFYWVRRCELIARSTQGLYPELVYAQLIGSDSVSPDIYQMFDFYRRIEADYRETHQPKAK